MGDACDSDKDGDGLSNDREALIGTDPLKKDTDGDGLDDKTEADTASLASAFQMSPLKSDTDGDGVLDPQDVFPNDPTELKDADIDGVGDNRDNCPRVANADQADLDGDSIGDACDDDIDGDGISNAEEATKGTNPRTVDSDGDGIRDIDDNCPTTFGNKPQDLVDQDNDGFGAVCDYRDDDPTVNPTAIDIPDFSAQDKNCDGIDGDKMKAIFVDSMHGNDNFSGAIDQPVKTLSAGIQKAAAQNKSVYVGAGTYDVKGIDGSQGVSLYGGYQTSDVTKRFAARTVRSSDATFKTLLTRTDSDVTLLFQNFSKPFQVAGFYISNQGTTSNPTVGFRTVLIDHSNVDFSDNVIEANGGANATLSYGVVIQNQSGVRFDNNQVAGIATNSFGVMEGALINGSDAVTFNSNQLSVTARNFAVGLEIKAASPTLLYNDVAAVGVVASAGTAQALLLENSPQFVIQNNWFATDQSRDQYVVTCDGDFPTDQAQFSNNLLQTPDGGNFSSMPVLWRDCLKAVDTDAEDGLSFGSGPLLLGNFDVDGVNDVAAFLSQHGIGVH